MCIKRDKIQQKLILLLLASRSTFRDAFRRVALFLLKETKPINCFGRGGGSRFQIIGYSFLLHGNSRKAMPSRYAIYLYLQTGLSFRNLWNSSDQRREEKNCTLVASSSLSPTLSRVNCAPIIYYKSNWCFSACKLSSKRKNK